MRRLLRVWLRMAAMSLQAQLSYRLGSLGFFLGKLVRLLFFFAYLAAIFKQTQSLGPYTLPQVLLFFLTFNIVDILAQTFLRGVYSARTLIQEGDLDTYLLQPCPPLLRMAGGAVDVLDLGILLPTLILLAFQWGDLGPPPYARVALYAALLLNGLLLALALHVFVAALAVRTQELENTIWVYRDLMFLGKFPVDIYAAPLRWALTLAVPIAVMVSFPAKALLGALSPLWAAYAFLLGAASLGASWLFWRSSLRLYTSVSS